MSTSFTSGKRSSKYTKKKPLPPSKIKFYNYQKKAIRSLVNNMVFGLFMDPGMGKTLCVLEYFRILFRRKVASKALVIAPLRVAQVTWPDEIDKWNYDFKYVVLHGPKKDKLIEEDADIYLINPEGLKWLEPHLKKHHFDILVVDESTKFKRWSSGRTKILRRIIHRFARRNILTGTPIPNGLMDIFSQIYILDQGKSLGRFITHFRNRFFNSFKVETRDEHEYSVYELKDGGEQEIYKAIKSLVTRMSAKDYLDLPPLVTVPINLKLPKKAAEVYQELENEFITYCGDQVLIASGGATLTGKLRQLAGGALYDEDRKVHEIHDTKITALKDLLEELSGQPTLVAYEYGHEETRLRKALKNIGRKVVFINDRKKDNRQLVAEWNAGKIDVLVAQSSTISHGLNMQEVGRAVIWFSLTYDLEVYIQFIKRIWRNGVSGTVFLYHLIMIDTIDEIIVEALDSKDVNQESFLELCKARILKKRNVPV